VYGPGGRQHLLTIAPDGTLSREELAPAARVKPLTATPLCVAPRPAGPNALVPLVAEKVVETLVAPMTAEALRTAIMAMGYSYTAFRKGARAAGVRCVRRGDTWWYLFDHHTLPAAAPKARYATTTDAPPAVAPPQLTHEDEYATTTAATTYEGGSTSPTPKYITTPVAHDEPEEVGCLVPSPLRGEG
jgi:hypothetical protein